MFLEEILVKINRNFFIEYNQTMLALEMTLRLALAWHSVMWEKIRKIIRKMCMGYHNVPQMNG